MRKLDLDALLSERVVVLLSLYSSASLLAAFLALGPPYFTDSHMFLNVERTLNGLLHSWFGDYVLGEDPTMASGLPLFASLYVLSAILPPTALLTSFSLLLAMLSSFYYLEGFPPSRRVVPAIVYALNPFTLNRLLLGQHGLLLAYALLPLCLKLFKDALEGGEARHLLLFPLSMALVLASSLHVFALAVLATLVYAVVALLEKRTTFRRLLKAAFAYALILPLSCYFLVPAVLQRATELSLSFYYDISEYSASATLVNVLSLSSYYSTMFLEPWQLLAMQAIGLSLFALFVASLLLNRDNAELRFLRLLLVLGFVLALGARYPLTKALYLGLLLKLPLIQGFRDVNKFVALLCLSYAFAIPHLSRKLEALAASSKAALAASKLFRAIRWFAIAALLASPAFAYAFASAYSVRVPREYQQLNAFLETKDGDYWVLWLPWDEYQLYKGWQKCYVADNAYALCEKPAIGSAPYWRYSNKRVLQFVRFCLEKLAAGKVKHFGALMSVLGVRFVALRLDAVPLHNASVGNASLLDQALCAQEDLSLVWWNGSLRVFESRYWASKFYGLSSLSLAVGDMNLAVLLTEVTGEPLYRSGLQFLYCLEDLDLAKYDQVVFYETDPAELVLFALSKEYGYSFADYAEVDVEYSAALRKWLKVDHHYWMDVVCGEIPLSNAYAWTKGLRLLLCTFELESSGSFYVFARVGFGEDMWSYSFYVDGKLLGYAKRPYYFSGLKWVFLGEINAEKGKHVLGVGSNGKEGLLDAFIVVPKEAYASKVEEILEALSSKKVVFVSEDGWGIEDFSYADVFDVQYEQLEPTEFEVISRAKYTVFTQSHHPSWRWLSEGSEHPSGIAYFGLQLIENNGASFRLRYEKSCTVSASLAASLASALAVALALVPFSRKLAKKQRSS